MRNKYILKYTEQYNRVFKRLGKKDREFVEEVVKTLDVISSSPFSNSLSTHLVNIPSLGKVYSSKVNRDIRIIWVFEGKDTIVLQRIGGHSGSSKVYR